MQNEERKDDAGVCDRREKLLMRWKLHQQMLSVFVYFGSVLPGGKAQSSEPQPPAICQPVMAVVHHIHEANRIAPKTISDHVTAVPRIRCVFEPLRRLYRYAQATVKSVVRSGRCEAPGPLDEVPPITLEHVHND